MLSIWQGVSGAVYGMLLFYALASLANGRLLRLEPYRLMLYMSVTFLVAVTCEVGFGTLFETVMRRQLWQYRVWPIHDGFTSMVNFIIWPVYGYYLYLLAEVLRGYRLELGGRWYHGLLSGFDGPLLEVLANGFFLLFYGTFYFYYLPGDLHHLTSIQVMPLYMVMGVLLTLVLRRLDALPRNWFYPAISYGGGCCFILLG